METSKNGFKIVSIALICLIIGGIVGFYLGVDITIKKGLSVARMFVDVQINEGMVKQALFQYYNNIGYCFGNVTA